MTDTQAQIRQCIEVFATDIEQLVRHAAVDAVGDALTGKSAKPGRRGSRPGRASSARRPRTPGQKRTAAELEQLTEQLHGYVTKHPGQGIEQVAAGLGVQSKELNLPVKKLFAAKRLRKKGQKRSTKYWAK